MQKRPFDNKIIIIGADHHNTLTAIRAFGRENCDVVVVVHGHDLVRKKIQVFSSKYVVKSQTYVIEDDAEALVDILGKYSNPVQKAVLFPCSDFAEMVIDSNYQALQDGCVIPGFVGVPGKACEMMDKWNQYRFAEEHGIPMAPTFLISIENAVIPTELTYPCIVKPRISALGSKMDIAVCEDRQELEAALEAYRQNEYADCIVQQFVKKEYEANALGFVLTTEDLRCHVGAIAVKIREQLESASSFAVFVADANSSDLMQGCASEQLLGVNKLILESLKKDGYSGQYDIDYLVCNETIYLNEINFRHSGNGYALVNEKINAPYSWACGMLTLPSFEKPKKCVNVGSYFMAELYDKMYIKRRELTLLQWVKDIKKTSSFAIYDTHDLGATVSYYFDSAISLTKRVIKRMTSH